MSVTNRLNRSISLLKRSIQTLEAYKSIVAVDPGALPQDIITDMTDEELCISIVQSEYAFIHMADDELRDMLSMTGYPEEHIEAVIDDRRKNSMDIAALKDPAIAEDPSLLLSEVRVARDQPIAEVTQLRSKKDTLH